MRESSPSLLLECDPIRFPICALPSHMRPWKQGRALLTLRDKKPLKLENLSLDQWCFQRKLLSKRGKCIGKHKSQLSGVWSPKGELWYFAMIAETKRRMNPLFWQGLSQWTIHGLFTKAFSPSFFSLRKHSPSLAIRGLVCGSPWLQILNCNSQLFSEEVHLCYRYIC